MNQRMKENFSVVEEFCFFCCADLSVEAKSSAWHRPGDHFVSIKERKHDS